MNTNRVTVRYAKALLDLAKEQNILDRVDTDMRILYTALDQIKNFSDFISNPTTTSKLKSESIQKTFGTQFHPLSIKFILLVISKKREEHLKDICRNFIEFTRAENGIVKADLTTVIPIEQSLIDRLIAKFESKVDAHIELTTHLDPKIVGGFVFTIDGQLYDASISSTLNKISKQLQHN